MWSSPGYLAANFSTCAGDRPLIAQLCGNAPATVLAAARLLQDRGVDAIDLNLGCPQNIAKRGHYGAFLLEEPATIVAIVRALSEGLTIPVTCKIRVLHTEAATLSLALAIEAAGASLLTVHGRTRGNIKQGITAADWGIIAAVKAALHIPVVANGSVARLEDAEACLARTGCDGVMVSEALLENPGMFSCGSPVQGPLVAALGGGGGGGGASTGSASSGGGDGGSDEGAAAVPVATAPAPLERGRSPLDQFSLTRRYLALVEETEYTAHLGIVKGHVFKQLYGIWRVFPDLMERLATGSHSFASIKGIVEEAAARYRAVFGPVLFEAAAVAGGDSGIAVPRYKAPLRTALEGEGEGLWRDAVAAAPEVAWCAPYFLADPAQPGAWYMRHRSNAYNGCAAPHTRGAPGGDLRGASLEGFTLRRKHGLPPPEAPEGPLQKRLAPARSEAAARSSAALPAPPPAAEVLPLSQIWSAED